MGCGIGSSQNRASRHTIRYIHFYLDECSFYPNNRTASYLSQHKRQASTIFPRIMHELRQKCKLLRPIVKQDQWRNDPLVYKNQILGMGYCLEPVHHHVVCIFYWLDFL